MLEARSPKVFLGLMVLAGVCWLLGALPILAALGFVPGSEPIEPFGRVVAFLFGAVFVSIGTAVIGFPLRTIARDCGAASWRESLTLGLSQFGKRVNRRSVVAALTVGLLAVGYWSTVGGAELTLVDGAETLQALMVIEFLIIHGFPFFVVAATFVRATRAAWRIVAWVALIGLGLFYGVFAWVFGGGAWGIVTLVYLLIPNVLAFIQPDAERGMRALAVSRWFIKFVIFVLIAAMTESADIAGPETLALGAIYFTVLTFVELYRAVEIPLDLGAAWSKPPAGARQNG